MKTSLSSLLLAGALGAGLAGGYAIHSALRTPVLRAGIDRLRDAEEKLADREGEAESLRKALRDAERTVAELNRALEEARTVVEAPAVEPAASIEKSPRPQSIPLALESPAEADGILDEALERHDIQALFDLAAALLHMGEPGYEKLIEVFDRLTKKLEEGGDPLRSGFETPLNLGPLARALAGEHENILRFSLYLMRKDSASLSRSGEQLRKLLLEDELTNVLLGLRETVDTDVDRGFLEALRQRAADRPDERVIRGLAYIDAPEATDVLALMAETAQPELLPHIVSALGYRRDPRALPALEAVRARLQPGQDLKLEHAVEAAIRNVR